jgi:hypothetical protein
MRRVTRVLPRKVRSTSSGFEYGNPVLAIIGGLGGVPGTWLRLQVAHSSLDGIGFFFILKPLTYVR